MGMFTILVVFLTIPLLLLSSLFFFPSFDPPFPLSHSCPYVPADSLHDAMTQCDGRRLRTKKTTWPCSRERSAALQTLFCLGRKWLFIYWLGWGTWWQDGSLFMFLFTLSRLFPCPISSNHIIIIAVVTGGTRRLWSSKQMREERSHGRLLLQFCTHHFYLAFLLLFAVCCSHPTPFFLDSLSTHACCFGRTPG
jgi:hypothetical protein